MSATTQQTKQQQSQEAAFAQELRAAETSKVAHVDNSLISTLKTTPVSSETIVSKVSASLHKVPAQHNSQVNVQTKPPQKGYSSILELGGDDQSTRMPQNGWEPVNNN